MNLGELKRAVRQMKNHFRVFEEAELVLDKLISAEQVTSELNREADKLRGFIADLEEKKLGLVEDLKTNRAAYIVARDEARGDMAFRQRQYDEKMKVLGVKYENRVRELEAGYMGKVERFKAEESKRQHHRGFLEKDIAVLEGRLNKLKESIKNL